MHEESLLGTILDSNLINFAAAAVLIAWFLAKFMPESVSKRKAELEREIELATKAKEEAETKLRALEMEIERAKAESQQIVNSAQDTAASLKSQITEEAKAEIDRMNANAAKEIDLQKTLAIESIKKEIASRAIEHTEKALKEKQAEIDTLIQKKLKADLVKQSI